MSYKKPQLTPDQQALASKYSSYKTEYKNLQKQGYVLNKKMTKSEFTEIVAGQNPRNFGKSGNPYKQAYNVARQTAIVLNYNDARRVIMRAKNAVKNGDANAYDAQLILNLATKNGKISAKNLQTAPSKGIKKTGGNRLKNTPAHIQLKITLSKSGLSIRGESAYSEISDADLKRIDEREERKARYHLSDAEDARMIADFKKSAIYNADYSNENGGFDNETIDEIADMYFEAWANKNGRG